MLALLLVLVALAVTVIGGYHLGQTKNEPTGSPQTLEKRNQAIVLVAGAVLSAACGVFAAATGFSFSFVPMTPNSR